MDKKLLTGILIGAVCVLAAFALLDTKAHAQSEQMNFNAPRYQLVDTNRGFFVIHTIDGDIWKNINRTGEGWVLVHKGPFTAGK